MKSRFLFGAMLLAGATAHAQVQPSAPSPSAPATATPASAGDAGDAAIAADRPGFATGTSIVPRGSFQLEAGAGYNRSGDARGADFGELLVRVPVASKAEVRVGVPSYLVVRDGGRATGFDDLFLETKISLGQSKKANYALLLNTTVPTGSRDVAEHRYQPGVNLASDIDLSENVGLTLNLGATRATDGGERFSQLTGAACFNFTLTPKTGAFAELFGYNGLGGPTQKYVDGGFTYLLNPKFQLDASAGVGLGNKAGGPDYFLNAGVARLF